MNIYNKFFNLKKWIFFWSLVQFFTRGHEFNLATISHERICFFSQRYWYCSLYDDNNLQPTLKTKLREMEKVKKKPPSSAYFVILKCTIREAFIKKKNNKMTFVISGLTPPPLFLKKDDKNFFISFSSIRPYLGHFCKKNIFCPLKSVNTCKNFQNLQNSS